MIWRFQFHKCFFSSTFDFNSFDEIFLLLYFYQNLTSIHLTRYFCFFTSTKIWTRCFDELFTSFARIWHIWIWRDFFYKQKLIFPRFYFKAEHEIIPVQKPPIFRNSLGIHNFVYFLIIFQKSSLKTYSWILILTKNFVL